MSSSDSVLVWIGCYINKGATRVGFHENELTLGDAEHKVISGKISKHNTMGGEMLTRAAAIFQYSIRIDIERIEIV